MLARDGSVMTAAVPSARPEHLPGLAVDVPTGELAL